MDDKWDKQNQKWHKRYANLETETGIKSELIKGSRDKLIEYFGEEWLKKEYFRTKPGNPMTSTNIISLITNPMDNHGVEVVELRRYLDLVRSQDNFDEIITKLKSSTDYEAIRLNLAVGFRLHHSGWEDIYVEPEIGDVTGVLFGKRYMVECTMISPPNPSGKYAHEVFKGVYNSIKKNKLPVWIHVHFNNDYKEINVQESIEAVRKLNERFNRENKTIETQTENLSITETVLDGRIKQVLEVERSKEDGRTEIGYRIANASPKIPGDIYSVDPRDPAQLDKGTITFGNMKRYDETKTTAMRIFEKLKRKKKQTKQIEAGTRRVFVIMANGLIEDDDWLSLRDSILRITRPSDNIDAVLFMDRRRHEINNKLRFPSGQLHFFTKPYRLTALEKSFHNMKYFENRDWLIEE